MLIEMNHTEHLPVDGIREEEMSKQSSHVAELSNLQTMDCTVGGLKDRLERVHVNAIQLAETLGQESIILLVSTLLCTAIYQFVKQGLVIDLRL
jgi:hypothetical protein